MKCRGCLLASCHLFRANQVRLLLGFIVCNLGNLLRPFALPLANQSWSLTSLRQRLFKAGGRLIRHARHLVLQVAESYLTPTLFRQILGRIERLAWHRWAEDPWTLMSSTLLFLEDGRRTAGYEGPVGFRSRLPEPAFVSGR